MGNFVGGGRAPRARGGPWAGAGTVGKSCAEGDSKQRVPRSRGRGEPPGEFAKRYAPLRACDYRGVPARMGKWAARGDVEDCLECRLIGTGAMLGISGYFVYLSRGLTSSTMGDRRFSAAMSVVFAMAGAARWFL